MRISRTKRAKLRLRSITDRTGQTKSYEQPVTRRWASGGSPTLNPWDYFMNRLNCFSLFGPEPELDVGQ